MRDIQTIGETVLTCSSRTKTDIAGNSTYSPTRTTNQFEAADKVPGKWPNDFTPE